MEPSALIALAAPIALILGGVIGAAVNRYFSDSHQEWKQLAEARDEANQDLRRRVADLEAAVSRLEGQVTALQDLNVDRIVSGVLLGLRQG